MKVMLADRRRTPVSPWVTLVERAVVFGDAEPQSFHSIAIHDYISVLGITKDGYVPLVQQYRPALERRTVELPGGLLDNPNEEPAFAMSRELYEETGHRASVGKMQLLGKLDPDSGRLENRLWAFFAPGLEIDPAWKPEPMVEPLLLKLPEFLDWIRDGRFTHAPHMAIVGMALLRRLI